MSVVIVGASLGGVRTAQALRRGGYTDRIVLVGDEAHEPYNRPPLSKSILAGLREAETLLTAADAEASGIELRLGIPARQLDIGERVVVLEDGTQVRYDELVIATGARARRAPWPTRHPERLEVLRTLDDSRRLRDRLQGGGSLAVIGAGFIGTEVAATAVGLGIDDVTVIDPMHRPMSRGTGERVGQRVSAMYEARGLTLRLGVGVLGAEDDDDDLRIVLSDGSCVRATTAVVGIGAIPNVEWLADSGLQMQDGVHCDEFSRCVGVEHVHAVGDVARWWSVRENRTKRSEHWTNAVEQSSCVAHNIIYPTDRRCHDPIDYVWSDQFDWKLQTFGATTGRDEVLLDNAARADSFVSLVGDRAGSLVGGTAVNWPMAAIACRRALADGSSLTEVAEQLT